MAESPAKATSALAVKPGQEPVPRARQLVVRRPAAQLRPAQATPEPDSAKRLVGLEAPARRLDRLALAFAAPIRQRLIPSPARLGCERRLCSYRSRRKWSEPCPPPRVKFSKARHVFSPAFAHNRFHAARDQSRRARSHRKARREARSQATWTTGPASGQPGEGIRCRPFQFVNSKDSIKRGSRTGKSEVRGTIRR
jgi:hypothetical protein